MTHYWLAVLITGFLPKAFTNTTPTETSIPKPMKHVYELAINQAKDGQYDEFLQSRARFVEVLGQEESTLNEGKWQPFFTVAPDLNLNTILIGMTHWRSMQDFGEVAGRLMPQAVTQNYFATFNPLAYAMLETVDGKAFDMESIKKAGQVVEFAIRKGKTAEAFGKAREAFFQSLEDYEGYAFAREFYVYQLNEQGMPVKAENTQAVIIVWNDAALFQAAATPIFGSSAYQTFAANLEVECYFATSPIAN